MNEQDENGVGGLSPAEVATLLHAIRRSGRRIEDLLRAAVNAQQQLVNAKEAVIAEERHLAELKDQLDIVMDQPSSQSVGRGYFDRKRLGL